MTKKIEPTDDDGIRYVAFLRGINVGGHRLIKMTDLAELFRGLGFRDVRTVIASGNVVFTADETDLAALVERIERGLAAAHGYEVRVMVRTVASLRVLVERDPFPAEDDPSTNRYVVFFPAIPAGAPEPPIAKEDDGFAIVGRDEDALLVVARMLPSGTRADYGPFLAKQFGKVSTARNWNTVVKIAAMEAVGGPPASGSGRGGRD